MKSLLRRKADALRIYRDATVRALEALEEPNPDLPYALEQINTRERMARILGDLPETAEPGRDHPDYPDWQECTRLLAQDSELVERLVRRLEAMREEILMAIRDLDQRTPPHRPAYGHASHGRAIDLTG